MPTKQTAAISQEEIINLKYLLLTSKLLYISNRYIKLERYTKLLKMS